MSTSREDRPQVRDYSSEKHTLDFTIKGGKYYMPPIDFPDVEKLSELGALQGMEQAIAFREFIASRARSRRSPFMAWLMRQPSAYDAVKAMGIIDSKDMFEEWMSMQGMKKDKLGESSGSSS